MTNSYNPLKILLCLALAPCCFGDAPTVALGPHTTVSGVWLTEHDIQRNTSMDVAVFRSIPYAVPPVGKLRFAPPQPQPLWNGTFNATPFGSICTQLLGGNEDCLSLTVHVPRSILERSNRSVLAPIVFYIHGGGLTIGSGAFEQFSHFSAFAGGDGCVAVVINYRLNIFGFLAVPELAKEQGGFTGNFGIQDQLLALQWTQQYGRAFGGDPDRVTVAGQSSGGTSIFALMASPMSRGLFRAAISFSGSPNITMDATEKFAQDAPIVAALNCTNRVASVVVDCLRNASSETLLNAVPESWNTPGIFGLENLMANGRNFAGLGG